MSSPYATPLELITDVSPYFQYDAALHTITFIGESLELRIPSRFAVYGLQDISDTVNTLAVMDMIIDARYHACLNLLAQIQIHPSEMGEMTYEGVTYLVLLLKTGDQFMMNTQIVKNPRIIYALYVEFITRGKPLYTFDYHALALLFDYVITLTGSGIGVDRVMYELIVSHLSRDATNLFKQYRYTPMTSPMKTIALRDVSYAPTTTTSRLIGSYFDNGLSSSLLHQNDQRAVFEDLIRGIPPEPSGI